MGRTGAQVSITRESMVDEIGSEPALGVAVFATLSCRCLRAGCAAVMNLDVLEAVVEYRRRPGCEVVGTYCVPV